MASLRAVRGESPGDSCHTEKEFQSAKEMGEDMQSSARYVLPLANKTPALLCTKVVIVTSLFFLLRANAGTELMDSFQIQGYDALASFAFISVRIMRLIIIIILNWERNVTWTPG